MRELAIIILIVLSGYLFYKHFVHKPETLSMSGENETVEMTMGEDHFVFTQSESIQADLRVFGYNSGQQHASGPQKLISALFIAVPLQTNQKIVSEQFCERNAVNQAAMLQIIAANDATKEKISALDQSGRGGGDCAKITVRSLTLIKEEHQGKERNEQIVSSGGNFQFDPKKFFLVSSIEAIPCQ